MAFKSVVGPSHRLSFHNKPLLRSLKISQVKIIIVLRSHRINWKKMIISLVFEVLIGL